MMNDSPTTVPPTAPESVPNNTTSAPKTIPKPVGKVKYARLSKFEILDRDEKIVNLRVHLGYTVASVVKQINEEYAKRVASGLVKGPLQPVTEANVYRIVNQHLRDRGNLEELDKRVELGYTLVNIEAAMKVLIGIMYRVDRPAKYEEGVVEPGKIENGVVIPPKMGPVLVLPAVIGSTDRDKISAASLYAALQKQRAALLGVGFQKDQIPIVMDDPTSLDVINPAEVYRDVMKSVDASDASEAAKQEVKKTLQNINADLVKKRFEMARSKSNNNQTRTNPRRGTLRRG